MQWYGSSMRKSEINYTVISKPSYINKRLWMLVEGKYIDVVSFGGYPLYSLSDKSIIMLSKLDTFLLQYSKEFFAAKEKFKQKKQKNRDLYYHASYARDLDIPK